MIGTVAILVNQLCDEIRRERDDKCVNKNGKAGQGVDDWVPSANILRHVGHGASLVANEINRVDSDLQDSVGEGEQRSQREGGHKHHHETKLQDCQTHVYQEFNTYWLGQTKTTTGLGPRSMVVPYQ